MIHAQDTKLVQIIAPQAIKDNTEFVGSKGSTPVQVDTIGFRWARVICMFGAMDIAMATLKLWECDTLSGTYAAVSGADFTAALPSATDDNHFFAINIDLRGRKRFLELEAIPGDGAAGTYMAAWCELSRAEEVPNTAAERGMTAELSV
jgi:hypothetical protein